MIVGHIDRRFARLVESLSQAENAALAKRLGIVRQDHAPLVNQKPCGDAAQGATK